jgi:predicted dehydrogenase
MKTVKIGLIGCGRVSSLHVEGYQKTEGAQIVALCAPRLEKAHILAEKCSLSNVTFFSDYHDMIAQQGIVDAVDIMTPDYLHAAITKDCAEARLHILCEKPLALNAVEAQQMYEIVKNADLIAMVGLVYRLNPAVLTVKKMIDDGTIGDIYHFRARLSTPRLSNPELPLEWRLDRNKGGYGALSDLGSHLIDLARFLLDDEFASVMGMGQIFIHDRRRADTSDIDEVTAYDAVSICGKMRKNAMINIEVSRFAAGGSTFEIDGSHASVKFANDKLYVWKKEVIDHQKPSTEFIPLDIGQFEPYETNLYASFVRCIQNNTQGQPDFYDGLVCQKVLDAVDESIRTYVGAIPCGCP